MWPRQGRREGSLPGVTCHRCCSPPRCPEAHPPESKAGPTVSRPAEQELLTDDEVAALLDHGGAALLGWARRVRLEQDALDRLLSGEPEPSSVLPFGRRSSAVGSR